MTPDPFVASAVRAGLSAPRKSLPAVLFYDSVGSELFEAITELPEYYLTRTERSILEQEAPRLAALALERAEGPTAVLELGAGSATKTGLLLECFLRARRDVAFFPADVSASALREAESGLAARLPGLDVRALEATHERALELLQGWEGTLIVLYLGSSIGNYDDAAAAELLSRVGRTVGRKGALILGVDRAKPTSVLLPAYDDAAGVTAAFNRNVLVRINRELAANFDPSAFAHVAIWNEAAGAVEMHLESCRDQRVTIDALELSVTFARGERIHTESSHKYTEDRLMRLFARAALTPVGRATGALGWFSLEVAHGP